MPTLIKLDKLFYDRTDVLLIARQLLGKVLVTQLEGRLTSGRIVEVEAYNGIEDRASHAYSGRRTNRTEVMYMPGGTVYMYLIYGIHHLFNVVTNKKDIPHAILVRALEPLEGIDVMLERTGKVKPDHTLTRGPGNLARAMGLAVLHTGRSLIDAGGTGADGAAAAAGGTGADVAAADGGTGADVAVADAGGTGTGAGRDAIFIADDGYKLPRGSIGVSPRIGVDYAGPDALLPYRFFVKGNPYVSGPKKFNVGE